MKLLDILWKKIIIDFITRLSKSKNFILEFLYESIMVVINELTKYIHFISFKKNLMQNN